MFHRFFYPFFLSFCLASCSSPSHWVLPYELRPSPDPNIQKVELTGGPVLEFNHALGWYDAQNKIIEGVTILGSRETIPLSQVQRVELAGETDGVATALLAFLLVGIVGGIAMMIALLNIVDNGGRGCLILVQLAVVSAATMAAVVLIFL